MLEGGEVLSGRDKADKIVKEKINTKGGIEERNQKDENSQN